MNVGQLKRILANYDDGVTIILASDAEGNSVSPLDEAEMVWFDAVYRDYYNCHDNAPGGAVLALLLWPVN